MARPKKQTSGPKLRQSPMRLDEELHAMIEEMANRMGEPKATVIRQALRVGLQELPRRLGFDH